MSLREARNAVQVLCEVETEDLGPGEMSILLDRVHPGHGPAWHEAGGLAPEFDRLLLDHARRRLRPHLDAAVH